MVGKRELVRRELTEKLLEAAIKRIEENGLDALRARDVTQDAGVGLGTIYKCYEDLDDLIIHVNSYSLGLLKQVLTDAVAEVDDPVQQLKALAFSYLQFARAHQNLWTALFVHRLPDGRSSPDWHMDENTQLLEQIAKPIARLEPDLDAGLLAARTRTYFAAVHGIVLISLEGRFVGLEGDQLTAELDHLIDRLATPPD